MISKKIAAPKRHSSNGLPDPKRLVELTIVLASRAPLPPVNSSRKSSAAAAPQSPHLTLAQLRRAYGAVDGAAEVVQFFAHAHKLEVIEMAAHRRNVRVRGRVNDVERAFNVTVKEFGRKGHRFLASTRPLPVPKELNGYVEAVLGLHKSTRSGPRRRAALHGLGTSARLHDLARAYAFPPGFDGAGETIGVVEFEGGFYLEDIKQFCSAIGVPMPRISVVRVGSGANRPAGRREIHELLNVMDGKLTVAARTEMDDPFTAAECTAEVCMDIEIIAALAPAAHIVVYFASSDDQGLYHAINYAVHDEKHRPGILSISWSLPEHTFAASEINAIEGVLREAAHLGITVCASSGDHGSLNGSTDGKPSVNYPASSPHCLACGGTSGRLHAMGISEEEVWNATHYGIKGASGGGVSALFGLPEWQTGAKVPKGPAGKIGRGVPDVAGLADPRFGCELLIAGRTFASNGTSAVAPMWAALVARLNQALGHRCGHLHSHIYRLGKERRTALRPVLKGNNGLYHAGEGWNACTGYGTPKGDELLAHLKKERSARRSHTNGVG